MCRLDELPNELVYEILYCVGVGELGALVQLCRSFRALIHTILSEELPKFTIKMAVRQGPSQHLCSELRFKSYNPINNTITWLPCKIRTTQGGEAWFEGHRFSSHPIVRYLRVCHVRRRSTSNLPLSRPINLPIKEEKPSMIRIGHKSEVAIHYSVSATSYSLNNQPAPLPSAGTGNWMSLLRLDMKLIMLSHHTIPEARVNHFPPPSLCQWIKFQLTDPVARLPENRRFRDAVPWQPFLSWGSSPAIDYQRPRDSERAHLFTIPFRRANRTLDQANQRNSEFQGNFMNVSLVTNPTSASNRHIYIT